MSEEFFSFLGESRPLSAQNKTTAGITPSSPLPPPQPHEFARSRVPTSRANNPMIWIVVGVVVAVLFLLFLGIYAINGGIAVDPQDRAIIEKWAKDHKAAGGFQRNGPVVEMRPLETLESLEAVKLLDRTASTRTYAVRWYGMVQSADYAYTTGKKGLYSSRLTIHSGDNSVTWEPAIAD